MKRFFILLPTLLFAAVAFAAPEPRLEGFAEFKVELPRELRLMAGRGELSPVRHALVTIAAPAEMDMASDVPVLVISATSDPQYNSSRRLLATYADTALEAGWVLVAADPAEKVGVEQDDVALRLALNTAALAVMRRQWPPAGRARLAFGGFSGGAKYSGWLAAAFASQGRAIAGIYLAGINSDTVISAAGHFKVLDADFKHVPIFLQYGDSDTVATPADHRQVGKELTRAGFSNVRSEGFPGGHEINPIPLRKALDWFREVAGLPAVK